MLYIKLDTYQQAVDLNARVTNDCIADQRWTDGITNNYCNPEFDQTITKWLVPILPGYEKYFTEQELENAYSNL